MAASGAQSVEVLALACDDAACNFAPRRLFRRAVGDEDIRFEIKYCGVCHTDLHVAADHNHVLGRTGYPCVPGHELCGVVVEVGKAVKEEEWKVGDHVGVGTLVDSCRSCGKCQAGKENTCSKKVGTYDAKDPFGGKHAVAPMSRSMGGYSSEMVVHTRYAIKIPMDFPLEAAGPIMCAGITMYEPLKAAGMGPGKKVGIAGLGGLGVMGVKLAAKALGCEVVAISRGTGKRENALESWGAQHFVDTTDASSVEAHAGSLDLILDTIPVEHTIKPLRTLLKKQSGRLVMLGACLQTFGAYVASEYLCYKSISVSVTGTLGNLQEVVNLCSQHDIRLPIKVCPVSDLAHIYEVLDAGNSDGIRHVLDMANMMSAENMEELQKSARAPELRPVKPHGMPKVIKTALGIWLRGYA